jgi:hypothetical protein
MNYLIGKFLVIKNTTMILVADLLTALTSYHHLLILTILFKKTSFVFPSVVGHAKIIDKILADPREPYHETARNHKISFHNDDDDMDWK